MVMGLAHCIAYFFWMDVELAGWMDDTYRCDGFLIFA